jgi:uncharacterized protein (TIGR02600 family)
MVRHSGELRGAALVIVLSFLIIITGLVVAFLSSVTNDATATTAAAAGVTTRGLADSAIQLTIAQIRDATAGFARNANGSLNMDSPVCWASQPGAIRTYDTNGSSGGGNASGGGGAVYKLYSSTKMVDTAGNNPTNDLPSSSSWVSRSALYTDLNAPVITTRSGVSLTHYPIMDPAMTNTVNGSPVIDGFSISNVPAMTGVSNPAAMPVTWLYMLKDGTIIAPDTSSTTTATFNSAPVQPSSNNPIVGRIAFWTDDETCKLNINTASEGSFWAVPSFSTSADQAFAQYPPGAGEFNRYPGHPASTCLSPVLWSVMGLDNPAQLVIPNPAQNNTGALSVNDRHITGVMSYGTVLYFNKPRYLASSLTNYLSNLFSNVTPRYAWGGSFGGTNCLITNASSNSAIRLPTNRLYASVDEFFFAPSNSVGASLGRTTNTVFLSGSGITNSAQFVAGLRFFLTAQSRAPEVNPLNLPKISLWPVPDNNRATVNPNSTANRTRTFYDQVIAFCSSLGTNGTNAYYFTRYDASSSANDLTAGAVAGRNQQLYDYFRRQLNRPVPGFKGAFKSSNKWTSGQTDQIATEIYDYIRSCINLCDASMATNAAAFTSYNFSNSYTVPPVSGGLVSNVISGSGGGQVVPIRIQNPDGGTLTQGMGRFPTLRGGALWFTAAAANQPPLICYPDGKPKVWFRGASWIEISTNISGVSSIQASYITNVLAGQAWAQINPLHPWTTPFTNSTNINGIACVPQYNVGGRAVLADSTPNAYKPVGAGYTLAPPISRGIFDANSVNKVYPIFALSTNNGFVSMSNSAGVPTRTFPSYASSNNGTGMLHYGTNLSAGPVGSNGVIGWYSNNTPATKMYDVLVVSLAANGVSIATPSTPVTHLGLPFLTVQNTTNGAFDIPNANYYYGPNLTNTMAAFPPHVTVVQCAFLPNFGTVTPGASGLNPKLSLSVSGLNTLRINGNTLTFAGSAASSILSVTNTENEPARYLHDQGLMSLMATATNGTNQLYSTNDVLVTNVASTTSFANYSFPFTGGTLTCTLSSSLGSASAVQTLAMNFPSPSAGFATPKLPLYIPAGNGVPSGHMQFPWPSTLANNYFTTNTDILSGVATTITNYVSWFYQRPGLTNNGLSFRPVGTSSANTKLKSAASTGNEFFLFPSVMICSLTGDLSTNWNALNAITADTIQSVDLLTGDPRMIACLTNVSADFFTNNPLYGYAGMVTVNGWSEPLRNAHSITAGSVQLNGGNFGTLLFTNGADSHWLPPLVSRGVSLLTNLPGVTAATNLMAYPIFETRSTSTYYLSGAAGYGNRPLSGPFARSTNSLFWSSFTNGGDFDTGMGFFSDGPYMGKVDEGFAATNNVLNIGITPYYALKGTIPGGALFSPNRMVPSPVIFGSLPVGISGSGTNILTNAWKTLQFSPNPNSPNATNPVRSAAAGFNAAGKTITNPVLPDHLLLDFFQMPVVQPYPISDPFSMAGKVNMNYQIVPFAHINRDAAIRGVLKPVMITAVDARWGYDYKLRSTNNYSDNSSQMYSDSAVRSPINSIAYNGTPSGFESTTGEWYFHYPIHLSNTLAQFNARFSSTPGGDLFRSPSEICALWLYPAQQPTTANPLANTNALTNWDANNANITAWWYGTSLSDMSAKSLTGDNIRERPYNYLYPRLTTKSNTYQIHYRVQSLKQTPAAHPSSWATWIDPSAGGITDKILGEQRGSAMIERFIDPGDPTLPDFTTSVTSGGGRSSSVAPMDTYYRFRVFNAKEFTP